MARIGREEAGMNTLALTGGVFMNDILNELLIPLLARDRFDVRIQQAVPPNDGGIALGQAVIAGAVIAGRGVPCV
jgi:hydrogenase maturation protein HypF